MKNLIRTIILPSIILLSLTSMAQPGETPRENAVLEAKLLQIANSKNNNLLSLLGESKLTKEASQKILSGTANFLGTPNVVYEALFDESNNLISVKGELPGTAGNALSLLAKKDGIQVESGGVKILDFLRNGNSSLIDLVKDKAGDWANGKIDSLEGSEHSFNFKLNGNLNGALNGIMDLKVNSFSDLLNSDLDLHGDAPSVQGHLLHYLPSALSLLGFDNGIFEKLKEQSIRVEQMTMKGKLNNLSTGVPTNLVYFVGDKKKILDATLSGKDSTSFYKDLSGKVSGQVSDICNVMKGQLLAMGKEAAAKTLLDAAGGRPMKAIRLARKLFRGQKQQGTN